MGNENQITPPSEKVLQVRKAFLSDDLAHVGHAQDLYNLEGEFKGTRKTIRWPFHFVGITFALGLILGAVGVGTWIRVTSRTVPIDIRDFQDERLRDVLRAQNRSQNMGANLEQELAGLREERDAKKRAVTEGAARDRENLAGINLTADEKARRLTEISAREKGALERIDAEYGPRIAQKEDAMRQAGSGADEGLAESARRDESLLASGDQLANMRLKAARDTYEERIRRMQVAHDLDIKALIAKYNPTFPPADRVNAVLAQNGAGAPGKGLRDYDRQLADEAEFNIAQFSQLRADYSNHQILVRRLRQVPYTNSIPKTLDRMDQLSTAIVDSYETLWERLVGALKRRTTALSAYENALAHMSREKSDNGYLLDTRDPARIAIYLSPLSVGMAPKGAYIYRLEDEPIGRVEFYSENGRLLAKQVESITGKSLQPFDRILLIR